MQTVRKKVIDTFWINKCRKEVCKCFETLNGKDTVTIKDVNLHKECFNCAKINDIIKVRLPSGAMVVDQPSMYKSKNDPSYPPLL